MVNFYEKFGELRATPLCTRLGVTRNQFLGMVQKDRFWAQKVVDTLDQIWSSKSSRSILAECPTSAFTHTTSGDVVLHISL